MEALLDLLDISKFRLSAMYCVIRKDVQIAQYSVNYMMKTVHSSDKNEQAMQNKVDWFAINAM